MSRSGIVNVRMVITEEKILSNIDKIQKLINPRSKKQIVQLEEDTYFKDLIESVKTYLLEYPKKKNFPISVYKSAYNLVEFATNQFEDNTKKIETLIRQREQNIAMAGELKDILDLAIEKDPRWKEALRNAEANLTEDIVETIKVVGKTKDEYSENYQNAIKALNTRINNLESNLHIEIDMERIEDRSKALSYIGIEIADALRTIPTPVEEIREEVNEVQESVVEPVIEQSVQNPVINQVQPQVATPTPQNVPVNEGYVEPQYNMETQIGTNAVMEEPKLTRKQKRERAKVERQMQLQQMEEEQAQYEQETRMDVKPSLWQRIKNSKVGRAISFIMRVRVVIDVPNALPEGRGEN